jgi:plastocyanin
VLFQGTKEASRRNKTRGVGVSLSGAQCQFRVAVWRRRLVSAQSRARRSSFVRTIRKTVVLLLLGLTWAGGAISVHVQSAAAATPPASEDTHASPSTVEQYGGGMGYPMGYPMNPYGSPYPTTPYGGMTSYPTSGYGTVMPSSAYPYPGGPGTSRITVTAPTVNAAPGSSAIRIANFSFNPAALTVTAGQAVAWTNADSVAHTTTSDIGAWNSGAIQPGQSFSQTFNTAGTFTYHCMIHPNMMGSITVLASTLSSTTTAVTPVGTSSLAGGVSVNYAAGWNLVAGPGGTVLSGTSGSLYAFRAGDTSYEMIAAGTPLTAGSGYWAYFTGPQTATVPQNMTQPGATPLPTGQFVLVGNPSSLPVAVAGADTVLIYDPVRGYQSVSTLEPGQGAWAYSANGGMLTMSVA